MRFEPYSGSTTDVIMDGQHEQTQQLTQQYVRIGECSSAHSTVKEGTPGPPETGSFSCLAEPCRADYSAYNVRNGMYSIITCLYIVHACTV